MPQSNSISLSSQSQIYNETDDPDQPLTEDVTEYAKRIGIDPVQEEHLLDIAKEGLSQKLPPQWKPCRDLHKKAWYYYNTETQISQWDHPVDEVYREKVAQIKADNAMNRIQNFNPIAGAGGGRNARSLPPLKAKSNPGLLPLSSFADSNKNGNSSPSIVSLFQRPPLLQSPLQKQTINDTPHEQDSESSVHKTPDVLNFSTSRKQLAPLQPLAKKQSGLTLSGSGASFLKSSPAVENDSKRGVVDSKGIPDAFEKVKGTDDESNSSSNESNSAISSSEMSLKEPAIRRPKSALTTSRPILHKPGKSDDGVDAPPAKSKGSVKFKLDENPELHFDISQNESEENKKRQSEEQSGLETTDEAFNIDLTSDDQEEQDEHSASLSNKLKFPNSTKIASPVIIPKAREVLPSSKSPVSLQLSKNNEADSREGRDLDGSSIMKSRQAIKKSMEDEMERSLQQFKLELEKEQSTREKQMKQHVEQSLAQIKLENEELIKKSRVDLEKSRQSQYDKLKREMELALTTEIDKIRTENQKKLEAKRNELMNDYEKGLKELENEISSLNKATILQQKKEESLKEIEKEIQTELKGLKEAMRDEQKKQIQQMKDYHVSFIEKLKQEFISEEGKLRKQHSTSMSETLALLNKDKDQLVTSLRTQQEIELEQLRTEFEQKRAQHEDEMKKLGRGDSALIISGADDHQRKSSAVPKSPRGSNTTYTNSIGTEMIKKSAELELKETELRETKKKYKQLEEKYYRLKQDLQAAVANVAQSIKASKKGQQNNNNTNDEISVGTGITSADEDHEERSLSLQDSIATQPPNNTKKININDIIAGSNDRLSKALSALELLRDQIVEIKSDQDLQLEKRVSGIKNGGSVNVYPTKDQQEVSLPFPLSKKGSSTRMRPSVSTSDLNNFDGNNNQHEHNVHARQVVESAKDFIKSQKQRLGITSTSENSSPTPSQFNFPRLKRIDDLVKDSAGGRSLHYEDGNTESSGIGTSSSLYNGNHFPTSNPLLSPTSSQNRKQVAKDIDEILGTLKTLDKQMKYVSSIVENEGHSSANKLLSAHAGREYQPTLLTPLTHPISPPALDHLGELVGNLSTNYNITTTSMPKYYWDESSLRYKLLNSATNGNYVATLPKIVGGSSFFYGNPQLDEHLKKLRSSSSFKQQDYSNNTSFGVGPEFQIPPSLLEKTKDLREWLENF